MAQQTELIDADYLLKRFPSIHWRDPINIVWPSGLKFACRICIAQKGLKCDSPWQWEHRPAALLHIENMHPDVLRS